MPPPPQQAARQPSQPYSGPTDAASIMPALIQQESGGRAGVLGPQTRYGRAIGLTQMLPATAREQAQKLGLPYDENLLRGTSPEAAAYQARLGQAYLEEGLQRTGNVRDALRYYHGGPNRDLWGPKTDAYADSVIGRINGGQVAQVPQMTAMSEPPPPPEGFQIETPEMAQAAAPQPTGPKVWDTLSAEERMQLGRGDQVQLPTGEVVTLAGSPFVDQNRRQSDRSGGDGIYLREPNATDTAAAFGTAFSEQIPFGDELVAAGAGLVSGRGYDAIRDQQILDRELFNETNGDARNLGGVAGFATGFALPGGKWVEGAQGLGRAGRAAALGAGYGGLYTAGSEEGGLSDRLSAGARGAGVGAATGGLFQAGVDRFGRAAANAQPTAARRLSREGVSLTPGQMMQDIPVVGPMIRGAEDAISSVPFLGSAVAGARNQGVETFNRAAINRSLEPIGQQLPRGMTGGYDAVQQAQQALSQAYDDVLPRVSATLDRELYDEISGVLTNAATEMPEPMVRQLGAILQNRVFRNVDQADATISGEQFKRIESELGALARDYVRANDPSAKSLGTAIEDIRGAMRNIIARQNPAEAQRIQDINRGYANLTRVERAAGSSASLANEGMFTPTQLGQAVSVMGGSRSQGGAGQRLMQDLASAGKSVLPNTIGDSGTAARGAMTALIGGAATGAVSPGLAVPVVAASLAYSKPAQAALNALYRATDRSGASAEVAKLAALAGKNPALVPYYEAAVLRAQLGFPSSRQERAPEARGLFGTRRPQTVTQ